VHPIWNETRSRPTVNPLVTFGAGAKSGSLRLCLSCVDVEPDVRAGRGRTVCLTRTNVDAAARIAARDSALHRYRAAEVIGAFVGRSRRPFRQS
jgi:hypothetical protein